MSEERPRRQSTTNVIQEAVLDLQRALAMGGEDYRVLVERYSELFVSYLDSYLLDPFMSDVVWDLLLTALRRAWDMTYPGEPLILDGSTRTASGLRAKVREAIREIVMRELSGELVDEAQLEEEVDFRVSNLFFTVSLAVFKQLGEVR